MDTSKLNRVEVIDHRKAKEGTPAYGRTVILTGPAYGHEDNANVELSFQDDNRTLKIFISDKEQDESTS